MVILINSKFKENILDWFLDYKYFLMLEINRLLSKIFRFRFDLTVIARCNKPCVYIKIKKKKKEQGITFRKKN
jgi:hypothetical protein